MAPVKVFHANTLAGLFIGIVATLSMTVAGGVDGIAGANPSLRTFVFATLFPFTLLLVLGNGAQLFTGNCAATPSALYEGKLSLGEVAKCLLLSYAGNLFGCLIMAAAVNYSGLLVGGTKKLAVAIATKKVSSAFGPTLVKGIGANWLVCMAISFFAGSSDLVSKFLGAWWPVMAFVAMGLEHSVANMFLFPVGIMAGAEVSIADAIFKNMIPATLGNMIAGFVFVAASNSFAFGSLGA